MVVSLGVPIFRVFTVLASPHYRYFLWCSSHHFLQQVFSIVLFNGVIINHSLTCSITHLHTCQYEWVHIHALQHYNIMNVGLTGAIIPKEC